MLDLLVNIKVISGWEYTYYLPSLDRKFHFCFFLITSVDTLHNHTTHSVLHNMTKTAPSCMCGSWYRDNDVYRFQEHTGRRWRALHGNFTPCGSRRLPSLPATAHIAEANCAHSVSAIGENFISLCCFSSPRKAYGLFWEPIDASTLGLRLGNRISPICGSSPPDPPRPVCARTAALPIPPFSKWGHGLLNSRTAFLSDAYRTYPMDLFNYRTVASPHKPAKKSVGLCRLVVGVKSPLILRGISARSSFPNKLLSLLIVLVFE